MRELQLRQPVHQTPATRNAFADLQARADVAYVALGERASPSDGERKHSRLSGQASPRAAAAFQKWKDTELAVIARDSSTLNTVCDQIRADAVEYGLNPPDLKPFEHRMIRETLPGGHQATRFVGNGTIFKQMSRPVRHVAFIGTRN